MNVHRFAVAMAALLLALSACAKDVIKLAPDHCSQPGRYLAEGEAPEPRDVALDAYCAERIGQRVAPLGTVSVIGGARVREGEAAYALTRSFARLWGEGALGRRYPILTGGGPGIMEAANRGAFEAGAPSLGFGHFFSRGAEERMNAFVTEGYQFASFAQREAELIDRAAAIVMVKGGVGTYWEFFELLSKIQTHKIPRIPVILLGKRSEWSYLVRFLEHLRDIDTIQGEELRYFQVAEGAEEAVNILSSQLK